MEQKIKLIHPAGKKGISMDLEKFKVMEKAILKALQSNAELTHTELLAKVTDDFKRSKIKFEGSVEWHMEWVKLHLEAGKTIKRIADKPPVRFKLT